MTRRQCCGRCDDKVRAGSWRAANIDRRIAKRRRCARGGAVFKTADPRSQCCHRCGALFRPRRLFAIGDRYFADLCARTGSFQIAQSRLSTLIRSHRRRDGGLPVPLRVQPHRRSASQRGGAGSADLPIQHNPEGQDAERGRIGKSDPRPSWQGNGENQCGAKPARGRCACLARSRART
ncbi:hypothetical protein D9M72_473670 [compost metagenome]